MRVHVEGPSHARQREEEVTAMSAPWAARVSGRNDLAVAELRFRKDNPSLRDRPGREDETAFPGLCYQSRRRMTLPDGSEGLFMRV